MSRSRGRKGRPVHGWLVVDKPEGVSSAGIVAQAKRAFNAAKVGHGGTLDPLASGILPLAFGEATKVMPYVLRHDKTYDFTIAWGTATATADREGEVIATHPHRPTAADILAVIPEFVGTITQTPPAYSALKVDGKPAYARARAGEAVTLPERIVSIYALTLTAADANTACFTVACGTGTYIRSLAEAIAQRLGTVGHVHALRRTHVSGFTNAPSYAINHVLDVPEGERETLLQPLDTPLADIPTLVLSVAEAKRLQHGQRLARPDTPDAAALRIYVGNTFIGMVGSAKGVVQPLRLFNHITMEDEDVHYRRT